MKTPKPISFLEASFLSLKEYIDSEINDQKAFFSADYIKQLRSETTDIQIFCKELNEDNSFVQKANLLVNPNSSKGLLFKAEHFFISDLIILYNQNSKAETEKSQFTLAYYYDVLRNDHFADERGIKILNKLVSSEKFKNHLQKIKNENTISCLSSTANFCFLACVLYEMNHPKKHELLDKYQQFLHFSLGIKQNDKTVSEIANQSKEPIHNSNICPVPENDSLEKVMEELNQLIGLETVKTDVTALINLIKVQKKRNQEGLKNIEISLHTVFLGPPGTGKTTVARLLGRIFKHLGLLSLGQTIETDREGMIAGFVGQTATKVDKVVVKSKGGVLFIDEAYALTNNSLGNDYGAEAVNTLLKRMEDFRDDLAVVAAGYTEPMKEFVESNPGLRSRFNRFFHFDHFNPTELFQIFENFCKNADFIINADAKEKLIDTFELLYSKKEESFGNARVVRNIFEKCVQNQANRIVQLPTITSEILKTLTDVDIPEPKETEKLTNFTTK